MADLLVKELGNDDFEKWNEFVGNSPQGTVFHKSYWLRASGENFRIYGCFKNGNLVAGLPIVCRSRFGIKYGIHSPLTPYLGILFNDSEAKYVSRISEEKNISRAVAKKIKEDFGQIKFSFSPLITDLQPFVWEGFSINVSYTYLLDLTDLERVWTDMDDSRRNDIRRAEKDGISIELTKNFKETLSSLYDGYEKRIP